MQLLALTCDSRAGSYSPGVDSDSGGEWTRGGANCEHHSSHGSHHQHVSEFPPRPTEKLSLSSLFVMIITIDCLDGWNLMLVSVRDGAAIGYPCAISFLAHAAQLERKLNIGTWINVGLGSSLGSAGAAPVPNAGRPRGCNVHWYFPNSRHLVLSLVFSITGIVMLITVWETAMPGYSVPDAIAYVQGIEFIVDRFQTATNVCSDLFILRMIQSAVDKDRKSIVYIDENN